jgi:hypothetical protein
LRVEGQRAAFGSFRFSGFGEWAAVEAFLKSGMGQMEAFGRFLKSGMGEWEAFGSFRKSGMGQRAAFGWFLKSGMGEWDAFGSFRKSGMALWRVFGVVCGQGWAGACMFQEPPAGARAEWSQARPLLTTEVRVGNLPTSYPGALGTATPYRRSPVLVTYPREETVRTQFSVPKGLAAISRALGSVTQRPSTTKRYS